MLWFILELFRKQFLVHVILVAIIDNPPFLLQQ